MTFNVGRDGYVGLFLFPFLQYWVMLHYCIFMNFIYFYLWGKIWIGTVTGTNHVESRSSVKDIVVW